jgi:hypothetical protein
VPHAAEGVPCGGLLATAAAPPQSPLALTLSCCPCSHRLNYINDFDPESHKFKRPIYAIDAYVTKTGKLDCYKPKGAWDNPDKRNWLKYEVCIVLCVLVCVCCGAEGRGAGRVLGVV